MKKNVNNTVFLVILAAIVLFFSFSYIFVKAKSFSEDENRMLQTSPRFTFEKLMDGTYTRQLHDYFSDQINLRTLMIELKASVELLMGKNENNGVLLGRDGYLIETDLYTDAQLSYLESNLKRIELLSTALQESGVSSTSALIPRKVDVFKDMLPPYYSPDRNELAWDLVGDIHVSLTNDLAFDGAFYRTDHHWTDEGAYAAYCALSKHLGYSPMLRDTFHPTVLSNEFFGTTYSTSGFFFVGADTISAPAVDKGRYKTEIVDIEYTFDGVYDTDYLAKKDKYSVFLSGNNAHVKIYDTADTGKETLLIIKDSFSHSLAPYLLEHYDLELIDPRYFTGSIEEYIDDNDIDRVLFLFGIDTLASANLSIR